MIRKLVAIASLFGILSAGSAHSANLAVFTDPQYVDESPTGEPILLQRCLTDSLGHHVTAFSGTSSAEWSAALANADVLVIPEMEDTNALADSLSPAAKDVIRSFVQSQGRGLVICGDFQSPPESNATRLLNSVFSFSLEFTGDTGLNSTLQAAAAAGTAFQEGIGVDPLPYGNGTYELSTSSLPPGALNLYARGDTTTVFATTVGTGRIVYLAYDWFLSTPPIEWVNVLGSAVVHAAHYRARRVAVFTDSVFVDKGEEAARLQAHLTSLGHEVTTFEGTTAATWEAVLRNAEVLAIPEQERADVFAALPTGTRDVLTRYLMSGGGLILCGDFSARALALLNGVFGSSLVLSGSAVGTLNPAGAAGTPFADGPRSLPSSSLVQGATTASLPAGAAALYTNGSNTQVFRLSRGLGKTVLLGFDYFAFAPAPAAWRSALQHAVTYVAGPPDIALSAPAVAPGATAQVTADLSGFFGLSISNLRFRQGGDAGFLTVPLVQSAPTVWSATIPGSSVGTKGVQFILDLGDGTRVGTSPLLANGAHTHNLPVTLSNFEVASLGAGSYTLRGLPMQAANASPEAVFDELGAYDVKKWRYGTFNGSGYSEPGGGARSAVPGQGFWIIAKNATSIATNGTTTNLADPLDLTLSPGFNQIANPFNFPVAFSSVTRPAEVEDNLIGFDGSGYVNNVTTLQPGQGYWIKNNAGAARTLSIPPLGAGVAPAPPALPAGDLAETDWALRLDATCGGFTDRDNVLGARAGASEDRDAFDRSEPPPAPSGWVRVAFASATDGELVADWRPAGEEGVTSQVTFASDQYGLPFTIRLTPERPLPEGWDVLAFEDARAIDLGETREISGTVGSSTTPRTFTVSVGSPAYLGQVRTAAQQSVTAFALGSPFPNPAWAGVTLDLAVPRAVEDASVRVFDVNGRLVRTLLQGPVSQGIQRVAWDGRDESGRRTAAGVYFVKSRAASFTATRKVVLLP